MLISSAPLVGWRVEAVLATEVIAPRLAAVVVSNVVLVVEGGAVA